MRCNNIKHGNCNYMVLISEVMSVYYFAKKKNIPTNHTILEKILTPRDEEKRQEIIFCQSFNFPDIDPDICHAFFFENIL